MDQSATITVIDKQRGGNHPKAPYKIDTEDGTQYKCWNPTANSLQPGGTYHIGYKVKPASGEFDEELHITSVAKDAGSAPSRVAGSSTGGGGSSGGGKSNGDQKHWDEVDIRRHTIALACAYIQKGTLLDTAPLLDDCRAQWIAHLMRSKTPTVKMVKKEDLEPQAPYGTMQEDDWDEFK